VGIEARVSLAVLSRTLSGHIMESLIIEMQSEDECSDDELDLSEFLILGDVKPEPKGFNELILGDVKSEQKGFSEFILGDVKTEQECFSELILGDIKTEPKVYGESILGEVKTESTDFGELKEQWLYS